MKQNRKKQQITDPTNSHIYKLIGISIVAKIILVLVTIFVLGSFIDTFAITYYSDNVAGIFSGKVPYIDYAFEYPVLAIIPMILALVPTAIFGHTIAPIFVYLVSFMVMMIICDCVTLYCIYKTALIVWGSHKQAFIAGLLYATAFSVAYVTLTEYAAFATMLLMLGILFTVNNKDNVKGYGSLVAGFFTKAFAIIALPFVMIYNSKTTSLKTEVINGISILGIASAVLFIPLYIINPSNIDTYLFRINGEEREMYASSVLYMVYSWMHDVFNIAITQSTLITFGKIIMVLIISGLIYVGYKAQKKDPSLLIKLIVCSIFTVVIFMQFNSPNYWTWGVPLICILAVDSIRKMMILISSQAISYIVFPLTFYTVWGNPSYTGEVGSPLWYIALFLFTIQFAVTVALLWFTVNPPEIYKQIFIGE